MGDFYGTGIEIWAGFGPIGTTEKKKIFGLIMSNFLGRVFQIFMGINNNNKIKTLHLSTGLNQKKAKSVED